MRPVDPARQAERVQQILNAALECFREKGFHGAAMSAICRKAGMSPGHVYHYFRSKEDLIEAIIEEDIRRSEARMMTLLGGEDTYQALNDAMSCLWEKLDEGLKGALEGEIMAEATRNPRIAKIVRDREQRFRTMLGDLLKAAQARGSIDPEPDPYGFATLLVELVSALKIADDAGTGIDREQVVEAMRFMLRRCLAPRERQVASRADTP